MKIPKSFQLLWKATKNSVNPLWKAVQVLIYLTLILWVVFWIAEGFAQPSEYGLAKWYKSLIWSFAQYIGDPGNFSGPGPITMTGRLVAECIGIIKILIFAVPAGIIGSEYSKVLKEENRKKLLVQFAVRLHKRFRSISQQLSFHINADGKKETLCYVPRFYSFVQLQIKTGMKSDDIIDTVNYCPDLRLINIANTQRSEDKPNDRIAVTVFPLNREYGACINRGSNVTIVSTNSSSDIGLGNFAYSLAAMGGFNYISRELETDPDEPFSFYTMSKASLEDIGDTEVRNRTKVLALHFLDDLQTLKANSKDTRHWFILLLATKKEGGNGKVHFWHLASKGKTENEITINGQKLSSPVVKEDELIFSNIYESARESLADKEVITDTGKDNVTTTLDNMELFKTIGGSNVVLRIGAGRDCNAFVLRLTYDIVAHSGKHLLVAEAIADAIKKNVEKDKPVSKESKKYYTEKGGYFIDESGNQFETDPDVLKANLNKCEEEAEIRFKGKDFK